MSRPTSWKCDTCGGAINTPNEGWLEWTQAPIATSPKPFRICHQAATKKGCYKYTDEPGRCDDHLENITPDTMLDLLEHKLVQDQVDWAKTFRRLFIG